MPHHEHVRVEGRVGDIFFHRFIIETTKGARILADLGPKGAEAFRLEAGAQVVAEGEMKPSELKVGRIARLGEPMLEIAHKKHEHAPHHEHADPGEAKRAVKRAGLDPIGAPRRKPKHFEVLARRDGRLVECHVEFDGHIRKEKPVDTSNEKWSHELRHAA